MGLWASQHALGEIAEIWLQPYPGRKWISVQFYISWQKTLGHATSKAFCWLLLHKRPDPAILLYIDIESMYIRVLGEKKKPNSFLCSEFINAINSMDFFLKVYWQ